MRPFEVGDLIVHCEFGIATIIQINHGTISFKFPKKTIDFFCFENETSCIKTIRKPRPGNPESRAIVAMLAREYRTCKNYYKKLDPILDDICDWQNSSFGKTILENIYEEAKSMLK